MFFNAMLFLPFPTPIFIRMGGMHIPAVMRLSHLLSDLHFSHSTKAYQFLSSIKFRDGGHRCPFLLMSFLGRCVALEILQSKNELRS